MPPVFDARPRTVSIPAPVRGRPRYAAVFRLLARFNSRPREGATPVSMATLAVLYVPRETIIIVTH